MKQLRTVRDLALVVGKSLPGFRAKGRLLFKEPLKCLVRAINFDASAFTKESFYPTVFVQPLYMPVDYIFYTFGGRLRTRRNSEGWSLKPELANAVWEELQWAIDEQALPLLEKIKEPIDLALACDEPTAFTEHFRWSGDDINVMETAAYSWLLAGNIRKSLDRLRRIHIRVENGDDKRDWVLELHSRSQQFYRWLRNGEEAKARQQLREWSAHCAEALGLSPFLKIPSTR